MYALYPSDGDKADENRRRQDKLNLGNPSKRKIFAKKSPNLSHRLRI